LPAEPFRARSWPAGTAADLRLPTRPTRACQGGSAFHRSPVLNGLPTSFSTLPARLRCGVALAQGTSLATGLPRLVITTGVRVLATSSSTFRHTFLNLPAGMTFTFLI